MSFVVGKKLWIVEPRRRAEPHRSVGEVVKVGRRYLTVRLDTGRELRLDKETLREKSSFSSAACAYLSYEDYEAKIVRKKAWDELAWIMRRTQSCPSHLTTEQIVAIKRQLSGEKETEA